MYGLTVKCVIERAGEDSAVVAAVRDWFDGSLSSLGAQFRDELLSVEVRDSSLLRKNYVSCGEPGTPWGRLYVTRVVHGKERNTTRAVGSKEWERFLSEKTVVDDAKLVVDYLNHKGYYGRGGPYIVVEMKAQHSGDSGLTGGGWVFLESRVLEETFHEADADGAVVAFLREFAEEHAPVFAEVSYASEHETAFENQFFLDYRETVSTSREVLRGYSWITVLSQEIGDKLGGVEALTNSGAFYEVAQLRNGGYWLRATESYGQYQMPEVDKVFRALAPALPAGKPGPLDPTEPRRMIVREDAADYR